MIDWIPDLQSLQAPSLMAESVEVWAVMQSPQGRGAQMQLRVVSRKGCLEFVGSAKSTGVSRLSDLSGQIRHRFPVGCF